jgi:hypothetical protein
MNNKPIQYGHRWLGLGDLVYLITKYTGISWLVHKVSLSTGFECGCFERRQRWNNRLMLRWLVKEK